MGILMLLLLALVVVTIWRYMALPESTDRTGRTGSRPGKLQAGPVTDTELAEEVLPDLNLGLPFSGPNLQGEGPDDEPDFPVEQPEAQDDLTDIPNGAMPEASGRTNQPSADDAVTFAPAFEVGEELVIFQPDQAAGWPPSPESSDWSLLEEESALPSSYEEDRVTAILRNPTSLYVYWERSGGGEERLKQMLGEAAYSQTTPCLRLFDTNGDGSQTIDLTEEDDHWFLQDLLPGRRYVVSYERRSKEGRYYLLSLSTPVTTAGAGPATDGGLLYEQLAQYGSMQPSSGWR